MAAQRTHRSDVEQATYGSLLCSWDPRTRLIRLVFANGVDVIGADHASWFIAKNDAWVGNEGSRYWLLVDCGGIRNADPSWRSRMTEFHRRQGPRAIIAWFRLSALVRVMVDMFIIATPSVVGKTFASEESALSWLASRGLQENA